MYQKQMNWKPTLFYLYITIRNKLYQKQMNWKILLKAKKSANIGLVSETNELKENV